MCSIINTASIPREKCRKTLAGWIASHFEKCQKIYRTDTNRSSKSYSSRSICVHVHINILQVRIYANSPKPKLRDFSVF